MNVTLNNRHVNLNSPLPVNTNWKCSMIGCILNKKEKDENEKVFAVCCDFIISKDVVPLLGLVIDESKTIRRSTINPAAYRVTRSNIKSFDIRIINWETLEDISDKFEEKCQISLSFVQDD